MKLNETCIYTYLTTMCSVLTGTKKKRTKGKHINLELWFCNMISHFCCVCFFLQAKPKLGDGPFSVEGIQKMLDDWEKDHLTREEMVLMLAKPEVLHVVDYASGTVGMNINKTDFCQEMNGLETENLIGLTGNQCIRKETAAQKRVKTLNQMKTVKKKRRRWMMKLLGKSTLLCVSFFFIFYF
jgi:hypothetical protein